MAVARDRWQPTRQWTNVDGSRTLSVKGGSQNTDVQVSRRMALTRSRDTKPELLIRRSLRRLGLGGYRVNFRPLLPLRRTADVAFPSTRVAVMIDGCFWHGCPTHYRPATQRADYWASKISANKARDVETTRILSEAGWIVLRFWEHENPSEVADTIDRIVRERRKGRASQKARRR